MVNEVATLAKVASLRIRGGLLEVEVMTVIHSKDVRLEDAANINLILGKKVVSKGGAVIGVIEGVFLNPTEP